MILRFLKVPPWRKGGGILRLIVFLLLSFSAQAAEPGLSAADCKKIKSKIEHYQLLRRKGGSASEMDYWKKRIRGLEATKKKGGCDRYGRFFW